MEKRAGGLSTSQALDIPPGLSADRPPPPDTPNSIGSFTPKSKIQAQTPPLLLLVRQAGKITRCTLNRKEKAMTSLRSPHGPEYLSLPQGITPNGASRLAIAQLNFVRWSGTVATGNTFHSKSRRTQLKLLAVCLAPAGALAALAAPPEGPLEGTQARMSRQSRKFRF